MTGVIRPSRRLVYRDKRGESSVPVLELHVLDQDGMSLAEHLYLGRREWHAPDGLLVEYLILREDELQPPALGAVLERGVKLLSRLGGHPLHLDGLSLLQQSDLLVRKSYPAHFLRDVDMFLPDGDQLVGVLVDGDQAGGVLAATQVEFHRTSHVAGLTQVLLVLLTKVEPEIRAFQLWLLAYAVNGQPHLPVLLRYEREPRVQFGCQHAGNVKCQRHQLVGLVTSQHGVKKSLLFECRL